MTRGLSDYTFVYMVRVPRKAIQYLFFEMWPSFILGILVFIFILMMFQAIRYTEFVLIHGVAVQVIFHLMGYLAISFLPALFPMGLLFSVLLTYGRLSQDSEIVALKATGHSMWAILSPALIFSFVVALMSAQTSFNLAPWGNRQFELLIAQMSQSKAGAALREGTFSEGFFDLVIYANEVNPKTGEMKKVFIFDERDPESPLTVVSREGKLIQDPLRPGHSALLRLQDGDIHRKTETHTKIKFNSFDIRLIDPVKEERRNKSPQSLTYAEVQTQLELKEKNPKTHAEEIINLKTEFHKRWAVCIVCIVFALMGVGLGTQTNRRDKKSGLVVSCMSVIIIYWVLYVLSEGAARNGQLMPAIALWTPNVLFFIASIFFLRKIWD